MFIERYNISQELCKKIIQFYNDNIHLSKPGLTGGRVDSLVKESSDIKISSNYFEYPFSLLWLNEGEYNGHFETYKKSNDPFTEEWQQLEITEEQQKHIDELFWGEEIE